MPYFLVWSLSSSALCIMQYNISLSCLLSFLYNPYYPLSILLNFSFTCIIIYLYPCRTSCPKCSMCFFLSDISIFLRRKCYTRLFFSGILIFRNVCTYINYNFSSTLNSNSSAMDSSAIGVGVAVLVGKCMQGPWSAVPDIRSIR